MRKKIVEINEKISDNEIIQQINKGNLELLQVIIDRYNSTINYYVFKYCPELYREDAVQEATFALYSAVQNYDPQKSSISTFATLCIKRSVIGVLKSLTQGKVVPEELITSIEEFDLADSNTPEKIFFDKEDFKALTDNIKLELSPMEYKVLELYLAGYRYAVIADKLGINDKSVNNALCRIRKKLKR